MHEAAILVVIVNYRTPDLAVDAVASLADEVRARGDTQVVVVENGSGDESAAVIAAAIEAHGFGDWCALVVSERNGGFAAGNNVGIRWYQDRHGGALPAQVWLVNPDTRAEPGALGALVDFMDAHPQVGIAGGRCLWEDGSTRYTAFRFHSPRTELVSAVNFGPVTKLLGKAQVALPIPEAPRRVDWVSGSSFMVRRAVIEAIGGMDEGYFLYFEEADYCARAQDAGFEVWTVPASVITHLGGKSTGVTGASRTLNRRPRYWFASRARFFIARYGRARTHLANLLWIIGYPLGTLIGRARGRPRADPPRFWRDFITNYYGAGGLMYRPAEGGK
ncbi:glycosyltransferase family 2 protein [Sphingomonas sp.]|uniref:glycosyltransferase family 2 protein n=1 Tax=Sphingomonas sp. TaxID=28214 RepID=UPI001B1B14F7|nr:glycosyltransferase family 2 protein [Sphingomonas sp.]MBO9714530.1 glycosyltransferase family 2 protein [Sphingomonas sp.]